MNTQRLRQKILELAIHGKLVPQDPDDEPASILLERMKAEKEQFIKKNNNRTSRSAKASKISHMPFEISDSWTWTTLGEIGVWQSGGPPNRANKDYFKGNIPWLKTGNLNDGLVTEIPERISEEAIANSSAKINPAGSVVITMYGATIGKLDILTFPAATNQACCACIEYLGITPLYLFYFLLSQRALFIAQEDGSAQPNISKEKIIKTAIPLPPLKEQQRIVEKIKACFTVIGQIKQNKTDIQTTANTARSRILDLAIHGQLVPQDSNDEPASELLKRISPKVEIPCDNARYNFLPCHHIHSKSIYYGNKIQRLSDQNKSGTKHCCIVCMDSAVFSHTLWRSKPKNLLAYKGYLVENYKPQTVNLRLQSINKYLKFTKQEKLKVKFVKVQQKNFLENVISNADYKFLKTHLQADGYDEWYFIVWFMAATGARVSELLHIKAEDVQVGYLDIYKAVKYAVYIYRRTYVLKQQNGSKKKTFLLAIYF